MSNDPKKPTSIALNEGMRRVLSDAYERRKAQLLAGAPVAKPLPLTVLPPRGPSVRHEHASHPPTTRPYAALLDDLYRVPSIFESPTCEAFGVPGSAWSQVGPWVRGDRDSGASVFDRLREAEDYIARVTPPRCLHRGWGGHQPGHGEHPERGAPSLMDREVERLMAQLDAMRAERDDLAADVQKLRSENETVVHIRWHWQVECGKVMAERDSLREALAGWPGAAAEMVNAAVAKEQRESAAKIAELEVEVERLRALHETLKKVRDAVSGIADAGELYGDAVTRLRAERDDLIANVARLRSALQQAKTAARFPDASDAWDQVRDAVSVLDEVLDDR